MRIHHVCSLLMMFLLPLRAAAEVRVALVAPSDGEVANLVALAEAQLGSEKDLRLVERGQIQKVLTEQNLTAAGMVGAEQAVKLGSLLSAQVLAVVETDEKKALPVGLVVFDAGTGQRLCDITFVQEGADGGAGKAVAALVGGVQEAVKKRSRPQQKTVCLMTVRNADLPREFDGLCDAVGSLLERRLTDSPKVSILERKRLEQVTAERKLATDEAGKQLLASVIVIELQISREGKDGIKGLALLSDFNGKQLSKPSAVTPTANASQLAEALVIEVLKALNAANPAALDPGARKAEAQRFYREAMHSWSHKDWPGVIKSLDAAHAIDPEHIEIQAALAEALVSYGQVLFKPGNETQSLQMIRRGTGLMRDLVLRQKEGMTPLWSNSWWPHRIYVMRETVVFFQHRLRPEDFERRRTASGELIPLPPRMTDPQRDIILDIVRDFRTVRLDYEYKAILAGVKDLESLTIYDKSVLVFALDAAQVCATSRIDGLKEMRDVILTWFDLTKKLAPVGRNGKGRESTYDVLSQLFSFDIKFEGPWETRRLRHLPLKPEADDKEAIDIISPIFERFKEYPPAVDTAKHYFDGLESRRESLEWRRQHPNPTTRPPVNPRANLKGFAKELQAGTSLKIPMDSFTSAFAEIQQIFDPSDMEGPSGYMMPPGVWKGAAYAVRYQPFYMRDNGPPLRPSPSEKQTLQLLRLRFDGGAPEQVSSIAVPYFDHLAQLTTGISGGFYTMLHTSSWVKFLQEDRITPLRGAWLFPLEGGEAIVVDKSSGLPNGNFQAVAILDSVLYAGLGDPGQESYIVSYDLKTKKLATLASSRRKEKITPFDDAAPFEVGFMLADPSRRRVLFFIGTEGGEPGRAGIWEYTPANGNFRKLFSDALFNSRLRVAPFGDKQLLLTINHDHYLYDLTSDRARKIKVPTPYELGISSSFIDFTGQDGWLWFVFPKDISTKESTLGFGRIRVKESSEIENFPYFVPKSSHPPLVIHPAESNRMILGGPGGLWLVRPRDSTTRPAEPTEVDKLGVDRQLPVAGELPWSTGRVVYDCRDWKSETKMVSGPIVKGDMVYAVGFGNNKKEGWAQLYRFSLTAPGGAVLGRIDVKLLLKAPDYLRSHQDYVRDSALTSTDYYAATEDGLLRFPLDGSAPQRLLPNRAVRSVAAVKDQVFVSFDDPAPGGSFISRLDPKTQQLTAINIGAQVPAGMIADCRWGALIGDPRHDRLLFLIQTAKPDPKVSGLWEMNITTGQLKHLLPLFYFHLDRDSQANRQPVSLCHDDLLIRNYWGVIAYSLNENRARVLFRQSGKDPLDINPPPSVSHSEDYTLNDDILSRTRAPLWLTKDHLWFAWGRVKLDSSEFVAFPRFKEFRPSELIQVTEDGRKVIVADSCGMYVFKLNR